MKLTYKIYSVALIFCFLFIGKNESFAQKKFQLPVYQKVVLKNGLTIYMMEHKEVPTITISINTNAGSMYDVSQSGLANTTADALLFGTKSFSKNTIEETIEYLGASLTANAGTEFIRIQSNFAKKDLQTVLPIIKEVLTLPTFDQTELDKYKLRTISQLESQREVPRALIRSYFAAYLFPDEGYGSPVMGTQKSIGKLSKTDIETFYKNNYSPAHTSIAIVGDFSSAAMKKTLETAFGNWKSSNNTVATIPQKNKNLQNGGVLLINKDNATETTFLIGTYGPARNTKDFVALEVVNTVFGARFTSWLNDALRVNSGLTYGARSAFNMMSNSGTFYISTFTKNSTTIPAIDLALKTLDSLHKYGINEATLTSAKKYVKGQFPPDYETNNSLANLLNDMHFYKFNESFINEFEKNVDELTVAKTKEIVNTYFPKDHLNFILIGKASEIKDKIGKYGKVTVKEIKEDSF